MHQKNVVVQRKFGLHGDQGAPVIDDDRLGIFVEGAAFARITVNHHGYA